VTRLRWGIGDTSARHQLLVALVPAVAVGVGLWLAGLPEIAPLCGWDAFAAVYVARVWVTVRSADAQRTQSIAVSEDPTRAYADLVLVGAAVASLAAVGFALVTAGGSGSGQQGPRVALAVGSVVASWLLVHTVYTLRYARLHYADPARGVDFNDADPATYADFAYLAFTVGMTFQVSDTELRSRLLRQTVLRQALLSYLFGTVILATTVNFVAGLR